jgi:hypothetical protein
MGGSGGTARAAAIARSTGREAHAGHRRAILA